MYYLVRAIVPNGQTRQPVSTAYEVKYYVSQLVGHYYPGKRLVVGHQARPARYLFKPPDLYLYPLLRSQLGPSPVVKCGVENRPYLHFLGKLLLDQRIGKFSLQGPYHRTPITSLRSLYRRDQSLIIPHKSRLLPHTPPTAIGHLFQGPQEQPSGVHLLNRLPLQPVSVCPAKSLNGPSRILVSCPVYEVIYARK